MGLDLVSVSQGGRYEWGRGRVSVSQGICVIVRDTEPGEMIKIFFADRNVRAVLTADASYAFLEHCLGILDSYHIKIKRHHHRHRRPHRRHRYRPHPYCRRHLSRRLTTWMGPFASGERPRPSHNADGR